MKELKKSDRMIRRRKRKNEGCGESKQGELIVGR